MPLYPFFVLVGYGDVHWVYGGIFLCTWCSTRGIYWKEAWDPFFCLTLSHRGVSFWGEGRLDQGGTPDLQEVAIFEQDQVRLMFFFLHHLGLGILQICEQNRGDNQHFKGDCEIDDHIKASLLPMLLFARV